jgi:arylformamidase
MWRLLSLVSVISACIVAALSSCLGQGTVSQQRSSSPSSELFDQRDANGDGVLTIEEVGRPRLFRRLDSDGDSVVTRTEAAAFLESRAGSHRGARASRQESAGQEVGGDIIQDLNIPYASLPGVDPKLLSLDIYRPKASSSAGQQEAQPVVVMIHGGGWRSGDKGNESQGYQKASFFVGRGCIYVSINYRLSPAVQYPAHVEDVAKALAWVSDHIKSYGGDPNRLFLMGHSAGAHLAALVTTDDAYLNKVGKSPAMLDGVILLDSAGYDIPRKLDEFSNSPLSRSIHEEAFGKDRETWIRASPINYVRPGKSAPPILVFYTARQSSEAISKAFVQALKEAGVPAAAVLAREKNHRTLNRDIGRPGDAPSGLILEFIEGKAPESLPASI